MNCPLKKAFTKCPSVLYQNILREFWCTAIAYDPNPHADETQSRPLKEYLIKFPGPKASRVLSKKRTKPKSKKTPIKTKVTPPHEPTEDSKQSHPVSSGHVPNPQDPERNKQLADSMGNKQPIDTGLPSTDSDEGTVKTMLLPEGPRGDNDSKGLNPPADMEPLTNLIVDPLGTSAKYQESDNEEVFAAGEEMDEDIPPTDEKAYTERVGLLKELNGVTKILKVIQEAVKEDPALNKKVVEATEAYTANSNNITELLSLARTFDFSGLKSLVETMKAALDA
ncbi:hypothetical protein Tco_1232774 [Tanacetum coccineum]